MEWHPVMREEIEGLRECDTQILRQHFKSINIMLTEDELGSQTDIT